MKIVTRLNAPLGADDQLYCGTLQLAWNELMDGFGDGPLEFSKPIPDAEHMNKRPFEKCDLTNHCHYETVGFVRDDVVGRIRKALQEKFGETSKVDFSGVSPDDIVAYAFLLKDFPFRDKYFDLRSKSFNGGEKVRFFGTKKEAPEGRDQTMVLYYHAPEEFAIRIKAKEGVEGADDVLVLARVQPLSSLADTIALVESRVSKPQRMGKDDILNVPAIDLDVEHHFKDLCGVPFTNEKLRGYHIGDAVQFIKFLMNKEGAKLRSEAAMALRCCAVLGGDEPKVMMFDKPFLLYMKSNIDSRPYFAMWVQTTKFLVEDDI